MNKVKESALELIGGTPILRLSRYGQKAGAGHADILAKLEYLNPAGSVKDRVALSMIEDAEKKGVLKPGATIIEPTSGNTGIGLAAVAAVKPPLLTGTPALPAPAAGEPAAPQTTARRLPSLLATKTKTMATTTTVTT